MTKTPEQRLAGLSCWRGAPRLSPILGGLSNQSFRAEDAGDVFVARLGADYPFHNVIRHRELAAARRAHALGFAPEIIYAEPDLIVTRFVSGQVLNADAVAADIPRIAAFVRRFHSEMSAGADLAAPAFDIFAINRGYVAALAARATPHTRLAELGALNDALERAHTPEPIVFAHHDLLAANLIDDGDRLWLIDYEYAMPGAAGFDLANLASNAGLTAGQSAALLDAYAGRPPTSDQLRSHWALGCASLLRETLWAWVSEDHLSAPGADYAAYARSCLHSFDAAMAVA